MHVVPRTAIYLKKKAQLGCLGSLRLPSVCDLCPRHLLNGSDGLYVYSFLTWCLLSLSW